MSTSGGTGGSGLLTAISYGGNGVDYTTASAALVDVDAAHLAVTFTSPPSRAVLVTVMGTAVVSTVASAFLGLREASATVAGPFYAWQTNAFDVTATIPFLISGLAAGSHTFKLAFAVNSGATVHLRNTATDPVVMSVVAL